METDDMMHDRLLAIYDKLILENIIARSGGDSFEFNVKQHCPICSGQSVAYVEISADYPEDFDHSKVDKYSVELIDRAEFVIECLSCNYRVGIFDWEDPKEIEVALRAWHTLATLRRVDQMYTPMNDDFEFQETISRATDIISCVSNGEEHCYNQKQLDRVTSGMVELRDAIADELGPNSEGIVLFFNCY